MSTLKALWIIALGWRKAATRVNDVAATPSFPSPRPAEKRSARVLAAFCMEVEAFETFQTVVRFADAVEIEYRLSDFVGVA